MPAEPSRFRLKTSIRPETYDVSLRIDPSRRRFTGVETVAVVLDRRVEEIVLHANELEIRSAEIVGDGLRSRCRVEPRPRDQAVALVPDAPIPKGPVLVEISWRGAIGTSLRGLYGVERDGRNYAFTQLEAADARRVFPCFDEPSFKARFRISVAAPSGNEILSNMPVRSRRKSRGETVVEFEETPRMSTYLVALAVGPLEASPVRRSGDTPIRVWSVPGKGRLKKFALEAADESLRRLETYFGSPHPYPKLDLVAVPDFEAGAMENVGAVFFRETLLLLDPKQSSLMEKKRAAEVIAHELAHMWFGNLVTMAWWDDLWLNEAFATWMASTVVHDWQPKWRMWESFSHDRAAALGLDALTNTHAVYTSVANVDEATENFDLITYEKGASVVRMIEEFLGKRAFRTGVRIYMRRHREGNTRASDLWRALGEASGRDVESMARAWVEKPGFPLVSIDRRGRDVRVRQERFFLDPSVAAPKRRDAWPVPLGIRRAKRRGTGEQFRIDRRSTVVRLAAPAPAWALGNAAASGFFRVRQDGADHAKLVEKGLRGLSTVERLMVVGDDWALVRANRLGVEAYLDLAAALRGETNPDVLTGVAGGLRTLSDVVLASHPDEAARFREWVARVWGPGFRDLGWRARKGETDEVRQLRTQRLALAAGVGEDEELLSTAEELVDEALARNRPLDPELAGSLVILAARAGDLGLYERYWKASEGARTPIEARRYLVALAAFRDRKTIDRLLEDLRKGRVPTQDVAVLLMSCFSNPEAREPAWRSMRKHWESLSRRIPPLMLARVVDATPALVEPRFAREVREHFRAHPVAEAKRSVRQALEVFRQNADLRRRLRGPVMRWLKNRDTAP